MATLDWKNVSGPNVAHAAIPLGGATRTIDNAFSSAQSTLDNYSEGVDERATQNFLSMMNAARTPEDLEKLRATGAIDQAMATMSPAAQKLVQEAPDARMASLRNEFTLSNAYAENKAIQEHKPTLDELKFHASTGNVGAMNSLIKDNPNLPMNAVAKIAALATVNSEKMANDSSERNLKDAKAEAEIHTTQSSKDALAKAASDASQFKAQSTQISKDNQTAYSNSVYGGGTLGDAQGLKTIDDSFKSLGITDPDSRQRYMTAIQENFGGGVKIPDGKGGTVTVALPASVVATAMSMGADNWHNFGNAKRHRGGPKWIKDQIANNPAFVKELLKANEIKYRIENHERLMQSLKKSIKGTDATDPSVAKALEAALSKETALSKENVGAPSVNLPPPEPINPHKEGNGNNAPVGPLSMLGNIPSWGANKEVEKKKK